MQTSRAARIGLRVATGVDARLHLRPDRGHRPVRVQRRHPRDVADRGPDPRLVRPGLRRRGHPIGADRVAPGGDRGDGARPRPRLAARVRRAPLLVLRSRRRLVPVILPIALPGIVTGIALNTAFRTIGLDFGLLTVIVGHATFCIVVIYNNVIARLRRTARSAEEASMDLGADTFQTFRRVTLPTIGTALVAGAPAGVRPVVRRDHRHDVHGRGRRSRRSRSGSSPTTRARTSCRSSTSRPCSCSSCRSCRSTSRPG